MLTAGIDIGSRSSGVIILKDNEILCSAVIDTRVDSLRSAEEVMEIAMKSKNLTLRDIDYTVSTGYGRVNVPFAHKQVTEIMCHGVGAHALFPMTRTVIDIGGQDSKAIQLQPGINGDVKIADFVMNDKCAAGTGRFLEVMAGVLEVNIQDMGELSSQAKRDMNISSMCTVFAESEVVSLIHRRNSKEDIARGLNRSIAVKVLTIAKRVGVEEECTITGGVAKNSGVVTAIQEQLGMKLNKPDEPQLVGALGAAKIAYKEVLSRRSHA